MPKTVVRVCVRPYCGVHFVPRTSTQRFCSKRCSWKQFGYGRTAGLQKAISRNRGYKE